MERMYCLVLFSLYVVTLTNAAAIRLKRQVSSRSIVATICARNPHLAYCKRERENPTPPNSSPNSANYCSRYESNFWMICASPDDSRDIATFCATYSTHCDVPLPPTGDEELPPPPPPPTSGGGPPDPFSTGPGSNVGLTSSGAAGSGSAGTRPEFCEDLAPKALQNCYGSNILLQFSRDCQQYINNCVPEEAQGFLGLSTLTQPIKIGTGTNVGPFWGNRDGTDVDWFNGDVDVGNKWGVPLIGLTGGTGTNVGFPSIDTFLGGFGKRK